MRIIVFDTETVGKTSQALLNVGYQILEVDVRNARATVLQKRNYLVGSLYKNEMLMINDDFVGAKKYQLYQELVSRKQIVLHEIPYIFQIMEKDLKRYNVLFGYAFNCKFDMDKFQKTAETFNLPNPLSTIPVFDIWGYAYNHITNSENYKAWARNNNQYTATGRYLSGNVESITRYLLGNLDFVESHTALDDTEYEIAILVECIRLGADITRPEKYGSLPSGKVFTDIYVDTATGETVEFSYTKMIQRDGKKYLYHN